MELWIGFLSRHRRVPSLSTQPGFASAPLPFCRKVHN